MLLTATMAAWAEEIECTIESTFTGWTKYLYEMHSEGVLQTQQGNDWDWYSGAPNPNWPKGAMSELNGESCFQFNLYRTFNIQLTSQFDIEGTVKAVIFRAGGNLGSIEISSESGSAIMQAGESSSLKDYTFTFDDNFKLFDNKLMVVLTLDTKNGDKPLFLQGITVVYTVEKQEEDVSKDIVSTFQYCLDDQKLVAEEKGYDWLIYNTTEGNSMHAYDTNINYDGEYYPCIVAQLSGTEEITNLELVSAFPVKGKVKKMVVRASGNSLNIFTTAPGYQVNGVIGESAGPFEDWVMDFGEGFELNDNEPLRFGVSVGDLFFIRSITVEVEGEGDDVLSGISGDLWWKVEEIPGTTIEHWSDNGYEEIQAYRLTFSGNGYMDNYEETYDELNNSWTVNAPWYDVTGIYEVVIGEGALNVGSYAFSDMNDIGIVVLPSTLKSIGYHSFSNVGIYEITLPEGLEEIESYAFSWCSRLESVTIPSTVTNLDPISFAGNFLMNLTVAEGNPLYESPEGSNAIIRKADNVLFIGTPSTVIPATVTAIGDNAFYNNYGIKSMVIPEGVKAIGEFAFAYSGAFKTITLPHSLTTIGKAAFNGCNAMEQVSCYANPANLTWDDYTSSQLFKSNKQTNFLVKAADLETWETLFNGLNVTFVGSLPDDIAPIAQETTVAVADEAQSGQSVVTSNGVVISLGENDTVDTEDGCVTVTTTMTTDDLTALLESAVPGSSDFNQTFKGIYFLLAAGKGYMEVDCQTLGDYQLTVKQGDNEVSNYTKDTPGTIRLQYNSSTDEWTFIFPTVKPAAARAKALRRAPLEGGLKIYSVKIVPEEVIDGIETVEVATAQRSNKLYNLNGQHVVSPSKGLYIVNGQKVLVK